MKIGITCYPTYGGSGAVATELGLDLADRGHEVHFISYAQPFRLDHFREGIFFHEVEMDQYPLFEHPPYSLALACGTPVIASRMGGLPEVVVHGETGFLFPMGAVEDMAEAGISLLKDRDRWTRFSQAARADSVERFSNDRIIPISEDLYRDVVEGDFGSG